MQFNSGKRELTLKIVYYGPALSGKTTNLRALHTLLDPSSRGELTTLDTKGDRTLFFDLLPVHFRTRSGVKVNVKLFTVPGQVVHETTRRIVLAGTDAIVFVADSQVKATAANNESFRTMYANLKQNGLDPAKVPTAIQFNKRDLPDIKSDAEIEESRKKGREPVFTAVAIRGIGVVETLEGVSRLLFAALDAEHDFSRKFGVTEAEFISGAFGMLKPPAEPSRSEVEP